MFYKCVYVFHFLFFELFFLSFDNFIHSAGILYIILSDFNTLLVKHIPLFISFQNKYFISSLIKATGQGLDRWLRGGEHLILLQRTQVWYPVPTWLFTDTYNCIFRGPRTLFWSLPAFELTCTYLYTDIHIYTHT